MPEDPHALLGVGPGASADELTAAYRAAARRWHPDRAPEQDAGARMADINAAYELLRSGLWQQRRHPGRRATAPAAGAGPGPALRRALGPELTVALRPGEEVLLVTPASTWSSPQTLLAASAERLLWLLDDVPVHRVRMARYTDLAEVETRASRRRPSAELRARTRSGRRLSFSELRPETAAAILALARKGGVRVAS